MDIYQALINDHNNLKPLLDRLVAASENNGETKNLLKEVEDLLVPHSRAEEAVFYNALRETQEGKDLVSKSYGEHMEAEGLLRTLQGLEKINIDWTNAAKKLRDAVFHHIEEEEERIFTKARTIFLDSEAQQMTGAFKKAKEVALTQGDVKNTLDMIINMMPKRLADLLKGTKKSA
jgi:hemerythrin superfamily protein